MQGQTVSHYRILEKIGEGGMGQVYLAEDTALERKVALKFLPEYLHADDVAHKRFLREAKSAAAIEHPYVCNIKEVAQTDDGQDFIVMEYVEGETLKDKLEQDRLPIKQALQIASEVAEALEEAHKRGVIHRDLKPSNIMVTPTGHAKVMDFGLAKRITRDKEDLTSVLTREGTTLGTLAYMSPEQLRGSPVDARADVFSLGVVLYEMLTGVHPFSTGTQAETVNAILSEHPSPLSRYVEGAPDLLQHTIKKMLAKQPGERYQTVHEICTNLAKVMEEITSPTPLAEPEKKRGMWIGAVTVLLGLVVVLAAVVFWSSADKVTEGPSKPMQVRPLTSDGREKWAPRLSPDGEYVAYVALDKSGNRNIYVRSIGEGAEELRLTDHPDPETGLTWSPDGKQLAFIRSNPDFSGVLYTIPAPLGGQERKLVDLAGPTDFVKGLSALSWSPDGLWIAKAEPRPNQPSRIVLISPQSGEIIPLTNPPELHRGDEWPSFSPDGEKLAFFRERRLWVYDTAHGQDHELSNEYYEYVKSSTWTQLGRELVFAGSKAEYLDTQLFRVSAEGGNPALVAGIGIGASDPDARGNKLVYVQTDAEEQDIWRVSGPNSDLERKPERIIRTNRRYRDSQQRVSPDGESIAFASNRTGFTEIWIADADGSNPRQLSFVEHGTKFPTWSPDGSWITFVAANATGMWNLCVVDAQGGEPRFLTSESAVVDTPSWSHDGQWIYFRSNRSGTSQIWKMPSEGGDAIQLTQGGGVFLPLESPDGRNVYYLKQGGLYQGTIWRVPVEGGDEEEVLDEEVPIGGWDILRNRLYYTRRSRGEWYSIQFLDLRTGEKTEFFRHEGSVLGSYLSVSSDERWIFYSMKDPTITSDLMLVENFH